jgi:hypothetical protein
MKRLTKKVREGLKEIDSLITSDLDADEERFPPSHPAWAALHWIRYVAYKKPTPKAEDK